MKALGVNEIREQFLAFFEKKGHLRLPSFSLTPNNDKSLLLINSGMAPLKPFFTGQEVPPCERVATCQKCIRTGDIENVGKTARHGTFFEMLGNFSFGNYFKKEMIPWSWEFVTKVMGMPEDRLFVTVYLEDEEAYQIWNQTIGVPKERIFYMGKEDNFWEHGLGPCGPCSEIYYDRGPDFGCGKPDCTVGCDCDRYMEFWNLVFTQFDKQEDGTYLNLAHPNIDTGMGLERMAAITQNVASIFDVDTIKTIRDTVCQMANVQYGKNPKTDVSVRVITDHIRSVTFMTADGILPSNEGRGYVLRRLVRRAARHGRLLGIQGEFLAELSKTVGAVSGDAYPQLIEKGEYVRKVLSVEETSFYNTLDKGLELLQSYLEEMRKEGLTVMNGKQSFRLYDTFGFPPDLTRDVLEEHGFTLDEAAFTAEMDAQKERARSAREESTYMGAKETIYHQLPVSLETSFAGYDAMTVTNAAVLALVVNGELGQHAKQGDQVSVFLDQTPYYAESGGQIGDRGVLVGNAGSVQVTDCIKVVGGKIAHIGTVTKGSVSVGEKLEASIDAKWRLASSRNHSATHLLQKALRTVLGTHVEQAGSLVTAERLRFDFTHFAPLTSEELEEIEKIVNEKIMENLPISASEHSLEEARQLGAMALFGEKYGKTVRVVDMGGYSIELCGGAHLQGTAQIGSFCIVSENGIAAGVRRIEALTGLPALQHYQAQESLLKSLCTMLKTTPNTLEKRVQDLLAEQKTLTREREALHAKLAGDAVKDLLQQVETIKSFTVLCAHIKSADQDALRNMADQLKGKVDIVVLAGDGGQKVSLFAQASEGAVSAGIHAGNLVKSAAAICGGGGGGRPNLAQAGGKDISQIPQALAAVREAIEAQ